MFCRTYTVNAAIAGGVSVASIIGADLSDYLATQPAVGGDGFRSDMIIQAPVGNGNNILLGDSQDQSLFIAPGGSSGQFRAALNNLFVSGTIGDQVIIFLTF